MSYRLVTALMLAMFISACGSDNSTPSTTPTPTPTPAPSNSTTVIIPSGASVQTTTAFGTNPLTIAAGTTISWLNNDNTTHTSVADGGQWNSGIIQPGGRFNSTFSTPGQFVYHCQIHPNMTGTIIVQ